MSDIVVFDVEIYKNYFLLKMKEVSSQKIVGFEMFNESRLSERDKGQIVATINKYTMVSFNGINFDQPIISAALGGWPVGEIKELCDAIIEQRLQPWMLKKMYGLDIIPMPSHIDLIEVAPLKGSLKLYGARIGGIKLQDLPIPPDKFISEDDRKVLWDYCDNDLAITELLFNKLEPQVKLRLEMGYKYVSKSDAQIAETYLKEKLNILYRAPNTIPESIRYVPPENIKFEGCDTGELLDFYRLHTFTINEDTGHPDVVSDIPELRIGDTRYKLGLGGIHSKDKSCEHLVGDGILMEKDVAAYYPRIILNNELFPPQLGQAFLTAYEEIVNRRLHAKKTGDSVTNNSLKIVINGLFGKFGSMYAMVYSPKLLLQTTITGQLSLLMLIERLELRGIRVVSANTDGVLIKTTKDMQCEIDNICEQWMKDTDYVLEDTNYVRVNFQNVNNYVGITADGKIKGKSAYADRKGEELKSNPKCDVVTSAVHNYLKSNIPIEHTIRECNNVPDFLAVRTVNGGAEKDGEYLGKVVRWYYSGSDTAIHYVKNGNKVPKSDGATPLMDLTGATVENMDINYSWYINEAERNLKRLGVAT